MKKKCFICFFVLFIENLFAQSIVFETRSRIGFSFSNIDEFVYENNIKSSHIQWKNYKPFVGFNANFSIYDIVVKFELKTAIPVALGCVIDKDFFISEQNSISLYSCHDLITDKDYSFDFEILYNFDCNILNLGIGLSAGYSNVKMEATDGYLQYPIDNNEWNGKESKNNLNGTVITYEQSRFVAGLSFLLQKKSGKFGFLFGYCFYPITKIECIDNHFLRSVQFIDNLKAGFAYKINLCIDFTIKNDVGLFLYTEFSSLKSKGNTFANPLGVITHNTIGLDQTCTAGTNYYDLGISLGYIIKM